MKEETYNEEIVIAVPTGYRMLKFRDEKGILHFEFQKIEESKEPQLPKSWEEFCEMFPIKEEKECYFNTSSEILNRFQNGCRRKEQEDKNILPDRATAEAVLALCQLIQLRDAYNGDWVPDWKDTHTNKFVISFVQGVVYPFVSTDTREFLYFKTSALCNEFLRNFRPLIEKLKPLYGIKEGGEE